MAIASVERRDDRHASARRTAASRLGPGPATRVTRTSPRTRLVSARSPGRPTPSRRRTARSRSTIRPSCRSCPRRLRPRSRRPCRRRSRRRSRRPARRRCRPRSRRPSRPKPPVADARPTAAADPGPTDDPAPTPTDPAATDEPTPSPSAGLEPPTRRPRPRPRRRSRPVPGGGTTGRPTGRDGVVPEAATRRLPAAAAGRRAFAGCRGWTQATGRPPRIIAFDGALALFVRRRRVDGAGARADACPGLLIVLVVAVQLAAGAVWVPVVRRRLGRNVASVIARPARRGVAGSRLGPMSDPRVPARSRPRQGCVARAVTPAPSRTIVGASSSCAVGPGRTPATRATRPCRSSHAPASRPR